MRRSDLCARRKPVARVSCGERTAGLSGRHRHRRDPGPRGYAVQQAACLHSGARTAGWQGSACWACHPPPQTPMNPDMLEAPCDGCGRRMEMAGSCRERAVHALTVTASPGRMTADCTGRDQYRPETSSTSPHRPPRQGRDHLAPAPGMALRARVDEPLRSCLRPAAGPGGLISQDTGQRAANGPRPRPRRSRTSRSPGTARPPCAHAPGETRAHKSGRNDLPQIRRWIQAKALTAKAAW